LHDIHADDIQGHLYRGYTIVGSKTAEIPVRQIDNYSGTTRPIWFVFSGMGSQWPGMGMHNRCMNFNFIRAWNEQVINALIKIGIDLMKFPVFVQAIEKCDAVLRPRGVDIIDIITNKDKSIFDNILHAFVGIAAIQVN